MAQTCDQKNTFEPENLSNHHEIMCGVSFQGGLCFIVSHVCSRKLEVQIIDHAQTKCGLGDHPEIITSKTEIVRSRVVTYVVRWKNMLIIILVGGWLSEIIKNKHLELNWLLKLFSNIGLILHTTCHYLAYWPPYHI